MADSDEAWRIVHEAILAFGLKFPDLVRARRALLRVIQEGAWEHYIPPTGAPCDPDSFQGWVIGKVPKGLETTVENLVLICRGDTALENELDRLLQRPGGRPSGSARPTPDEECEEKTFNIIKGFEAPVGTSKGQALRKLRKDAPELHDEVLAGTISAHAAMVKAGFRPKTITIRVDEAESVARSLRQHMPPEALAELVDLLQGKKRWLKSM